jgi:hypothetical protein
MNLFHTFAAHCITVLGRYGFSRVNEGFYFLILRNSSDFDDFFFNVCIYILFEIRNILFGARKYLYCLNNNLLFMEKNPFSTIFISKIFLYGN